MSAFAHRDNNRMGEKTAETMLKEVNEVVGEQKTKYGARDPVYVYVFSLVFSLHIFHAI